MRTLLLVTMVCLPGAVLAQTEEPAPVADPTAHRHLGWIFRLDIGADYLKTSASQDGGSLSLSKPGIAAGIVLGHAVSEDWLLGLDIWGLSSFSPTLSTGGGSDGTRGTLLLTGFGLNATHYFMPANVYVSLSPSATVLSMSNGDGGTTPSTHVGFGGRMGVGKEWWVGDHWGVGGAVVLSATYN
ncbi:MAG TPA: hypothetical protein VFI53_16340 [Myxococcaceae bacterium]|nr:hypothetical protein [Myxococcaceae bacterium]